MSGEAIENGVVNIRGQGGQVEKSHKCSICGGPDHHGCGCEAKVAAAKIEAPALKIEPPAADFAEELKKVTEAGLKAGAEAADEAFAQLIDNREAMLAVQRDIVEQLREISGSLKTLVIQYELYSTLKRKPFPESLN